MDTTPNITATSRAESVARSVGEAGDAIESGRELPATLLKVLHDARLFRLLLPKDLDGDELDPVSLSKVTEIIAAQDGSTGWCLGQGAGCAMSAAFLERTIAKDVFGPANSVLAWGAGIQGRATAVDGGYRVSGRWTFASGSRHATWLGGHSYVFNADGSPRIGPSGKQADRTALFLRDQVEVHDDWNVVGLRGTGSDSYSVEDLFVPEEYTLDRENHDERRVDGEVYQLSTTQVFASAFAGVMLGIARGMIDDLRALALTKTPRGAASSLLDSQMFHAQFADLKARHGAARSFLHTTLSQTWDEILAGRNLTMEQRAEVRLSTTHAINQGVELAVEAYRMAGQNAIFQDGSFERRLRDANAASQQVQGRKSHYATVGRVMLGLEPDAKMFL
ncbi:MAG: acyl-CoA dehydrogenase family protein [Pseudomonadota bacterium]